MTRFNFARPIVLVTVILLCFLLTNPLIAKTKQADKHKGQLNQSVLFMLLFIGAMIVIFFWEPLPLFVLALTIPVLLVIFQPWTQIGLEEAVTGFSSPATIAILAMFILSAGIKRSGLIQILGDQLSSFTGDNETKQLGAITALSGPIAGFINNTPVVAIFIPMVSNLARRVKTSPSKLMMPLSFASMMGGTLTLIGSSTNLLASDLSSRLLDHPIGFFEFFNVGAIILVTGSIYLITVGRFLIPERVEPEDDLAEEYEMGELLTEVSVHEEFEFVGSNVREMIKDFDVEFDLVQIIREGEQFMEPLEVKTLRVEDRFIVRTNRENLLKLLETAGVRIFPQNRVSVERIEEPSKGQTVVETVIPAGSFLEGQTLRDVNFVDRYDTSVLAVRRGEELTHSSLEDITIRAGDVLLLLATETTLNRLRQNQNFILAEEIEPAGFRQEKMVLSVGILLGVILLAAFDVLPIAISALAGCILMVGTG
ncbi:MAG: SLC13 family permease, partial [bacterium]